MTGMRAARDSARRADRSALARRPRPAGVDGLICPAASLRRLPALAVPSPVAPVMTDWYRARAGAAVPRICNGFQILCEAHLLPGALTRNAGLKFITRDGRCGVENAAHRVDPGLPGGQQIVVPLRAEGRLRGGCRYAGWPRASDRSSSVRGDNPNGSAAAIAGVLQTRRAPCRADAASGARGRPAHRADRRRPRFFASVLAGWRRDRDRHGGAGAATAGLPQPFAELGLTAAEYERSWSARPPPHRRRTGPVLGHVERALLLQVLQGAPGQFAPRRRRPARCSRASGTTPAWSTSGRATRSPSRSSRTTTRRTWSPTRARHRRRRHRP